MAKNKRLIAEIVNGDEIIMTIDGNMLSCEFGALDRGDITDVVNWGIYVNRGSISFYDKYGYFNDQIVNSSEIKNYTVRFYLAKETKTEVASFKIDNISFDYETRQVDLDLVGKIIELQNKTSSWYGRIAFDFAQRSLLYLLGFGESNNADYSLLYPKHVNILDEDIDRFNRIVIYCPYLPSETAWNRITKICQASMCRVIEGEDGNPIITTGRPERTPIIVKPQNIISISKKGNIRIENASIVATNREKYEGKKLSEISKNISINYNDNGAPISISNTDDYSFSSTEQDPVNSSLHYRNATISSLLDVPYKLKSVTNVVKTESVETEQTGGKATYEREQWGISGNASVSGNFDKIYFNDTFKFLTYDTATITKVKSIDYSFYIDYFSDGSNETIEVGESLDKTIIPTNDLIQTKSFYVYPSGVKGGLSNYILDEVLQKYSKGVDCYEIECLFNDYYYEDGSLAFGNDDLNKHFQKYDVIIPYVQKRGETVPLRVDEYGTPKRFRVIGISYSYDGLLKQKLQLHEEKVNYIKDFKIYYSTTSSSSVFLWQVSGLEPNRIYKISWSVNESIFDKFTVYNNIDGYYCYYLYNEKEDVVTFYPISKEINDVLCYTVSATTDSNGIINIGFLYLDYAVNADGVTELGTFLKEKTNYIVAWE